LEAAGWHHSFVKHDCSERPYEGSNAFPQFWQVLGKRFLAVRRNILALPAWLEIRAVRETHTTEFPVTLHRG